MIIYKELVEKMKEKGITSFDYERIKAEEELDRNIATYVTFAADIFKHLWQLYQV
mgnify:CR=1 FL=1